MPCFAWETMQQRYAFVLQVEKSGKTEILYESN